MSSAAIFVWVKFVGKYFAELLLTLGCRCPNICWFFFGNHFHYFVGCGGAAGYTASIVVIGFNFRRKLNLAMGLSLSGKFYKKIRTRSDS